jgi:hypothetical protein
MRKCDSCIDFNLGMVTMSLATNAPMYCCKFNDVSKAVTSSELGAPGTKIRRKPWSLIELDDDISNTRRNEGLPVGDTTAFKLAPAGNAVSENGVWFEFEFGEPEPGAVVSG